MKRWLLLVFLFLVACTDADRAQKSLENMGMTDIIITGWEPTGCADSDITSTGFIARNPHGQRVEGVVCCGVFKNCTVRW